MVDFRLFWSDFEISGLRFGSEPDFGSIWCNVGQNTCFSGFFRFFFRREALIASETCQNLFGGVVEVPPNGFQQVSPGIGAILGCFG